MPAGGQQALEGHQADNLAAGHHQSALGGEATGRFQHGVGGGLLIVREVDADLGAAVGVHVPADGLAVVEETPAPDLLAQGVRGVHVVHAHEGRQVIAVGRSTVIHGFLEGGSGEVAVAAGEGALGVEDQLASLVVGLHAAAPGHAALLPQLEGNIGGVGLVGGIEGDVVGHEEFTGADDGGTGPWVVGGWEIRRPVGILELLRQALVLAPPHLGQVAALGARGGGFVEVDRDGELFRHARAQASRQLGAILHAQAFHGDKGHHVGSSHARMGAMLLAHVDDLGGFGDAREGTLQHRLGLAHKGDHRAVRVGTRIHIKDAHARHGGDGIHHLLDPGGIPAFRDVRHALHQLAGHGSSWTPKV